MPFRIENILRKDTDCRSFKKIDNESESKMLITQNTQAPPSILQQTLLNRLHPPYYRTVTDNGNTGSFQPYFRDRLSYPQDFYNPYAANGYSSTYGRRYYSFYNTNPTFFSTPYTIHSKRKGGQVRFTPNQTDVLEERFKSNKYLSPEERKSLAEDIKLSDRQVKTWFQNRRAKWKRSTSSSSSEPTTDYEKLRSQNELLNRIVTSKESNN